MLKLQKKLEEFEHICGDWDYRNMDMTEPHLQSIQIIGNDILTNCELFSTDIDDYISCMGEIINDNNLVRKFKKLDLNYKPEVLDFISEIESKINWDKVNKSLYDEVSKEKEQEEVCL